MRRARSIEEVRKDPASVAELMLPNQGLKELPSEVLDCANLQRLDLTQNELRGLPPEIGQLDRLERLDLGLNPLESLPSEISKLVQLSRLHLDHCHLSQLPATIGELASLRVLRMDHNPLTALPEGIAHCGRLEEISIKGGHLVELPDTISALTRLHYLDLENNLLADFPHQLAEIPALIHINVAGNPFVERAEPDPMAKWIQQYFAERHKHRIKRDAFKAGLDILLQHHERVGQHPPPLVFSILDSPFPFLREQAVSVLQALLVDPFAAEDGPKTVVFAGKYGSFNLSEAKEKLEAAGYRVKGNIPQEGAVLIVGPRPGRKLQQALARELPIGVLGHLERFLERGEGRFIKGAAGGELVVENLKGMLESGDVESESLAISLLQKGGMPADLAGAVASRWIFATDEAHAERMENLLSENGFRKLVSRIRTQSRMKENLNYSWIQYLTRLARFPELNLGELVELGMKHGVVPQKEAFQVKGIDLKPVIEQSIRKGELALLNYHLGQFPIEITLFEELRSIFLMGNAIRTLPPEIGRLKGLRKLFVNSNFLEDLPEEIGDLANLQGLNLGGNRIKELPGSISRLKKLRQLELWNNPIKSLPAGISELTFLEELDLGECPLGAVPAAIWELPRLQVLNLHKCKVASLPTSSPAFDSLQVLNLGHNQLRNLPDWIAELPELKILVLNKNRFRTLPEGLSKAPELKELWLSMDMKWEQVVEILKEMPALRRLVISGGQQDFSLIVWVRKQLPGVYVLNS